MKKNIVCAKVSHAKYWCSDIFKDSRIITKTSDVLGTSRDLDDYIFIEGSKYDYPPLTTDFYEVKRDILFRCAQN